MIQQVYSQANTDGNQGIDKQEFAQLYRKVGVNLSPAEVEEQFRMYDADQNGLISKQELEQHVHVARTGSPSDYDLHLRAVFKRFDANRDGLLDRNELAALFRRANSRASQQDIQAILARYGGRVDYAAFSDFVRVAPRRGATSTYTPYRA